MKAPRWFIGSLTAAGLLARTSIAQTPPERPTLNIESLSASWVGWYAAPGTGFFLSSLRVESNRAVSRDGPPGLGPTGVDARAGELEPPFTDARHPTAGGDGPRMSDAPDPVSASAVPEPTTMALVAIGLVGLASASVARRRRIS